MPTRRGAAGGNAVPSRHTPDPGVKRTGSAALFAVLVSLTGAGCAGAPRVISYYVDRGIMQYYLVPSGFRGDHASLDLDITVRIGDQAAPPAICNFTIKDRDLPRAVLEARFELIDLDTTLQLRDFAVLYVERSRSEIRLTSTMDLGSVRELLRSRDLRLQVRTDGREYLFTPSARFYKIIGDAAIEIIDEP